MKYAKVKKLNWRLGIYRGCKAEMEEYIGRIGKIDKRFSDDDEISVDFPDGWSYVYRPADLIMANTKKELK